MSRLTAERRALAEVLHGHARRPGRLDQALRARLAGLPPNNVARAWTTAYALLRHRTWLLAHLAPLLRKPFAKQEPGARTALLLGAAEILLMDVVPDRAAVDQAVEAARVLGAHRSAGFVNATLRRLARERSAPEVPDRHVDPLGWAELRTSHPGWILRRMEQLVGPDEAADWAEAANAEPPLILRGKAGLDSDLADGRVAPGALRPAERPIGGPATLPNWASMWVQDEAAQIAGLLGGARPGMRVLDACAAPGGKTFLLADAVGDEGHVDAVDRDEGRMKDLRAARERLGFSNISDHVRHWVKEPFGKRAGDADYDLVLVDAPCSGLGVIRRHPDIRWARVERDLVGFGARQNKLLDAVARAVRPGGALVYSVCTFTPEETDHVVERFESSDTFGEMGFVRSEPRTFLPSLPDDALVDGAVRLYPHRHDADGFFAVRYERRPESNS